MLHKGEIKNNNERIYQVVCFITVLICLQGFLMGMLTVKENPQTAYLAFGYSALMLLTFLHTFFSKNLTFFFISASLLVLYLELNFLKNGGTEGFGIIWLTVIPLFTIYLFSYKYFFLVNGLYLIVLILAMWTPLSQYIYAFRPSFLKRFPLVYILAFGFGGFLKYRIHKTEKELEHQKNLLSQEINQAALIQNTFFKQEKTEFSDYEVSFYNIPMSGVSGDLIDIYKTENHLEGVGIFDISGHGISSGLLSLLVKIIALHSFEQNKHRSILSIVKNLDETFIKEKGNIENYFTSVMLKINENHVDFINAGHPSPVLYKKSTDSVQIIERSPEAIGAVGITSIKSNYVVQSLDVESGDEIILYTDGIIEKKNINGELFGEKSLLESTKKHIEHTLDNQAHNIINDVLKFSGNTDLTDDLTILILRKK